MIHAPLSPSLLPGRSPSFRRRVLQRGATAAAALLLSLAVAGCGGVDDDAPTATLVTTPTSAAAGATVTLIAAAISDNGISGIQFYRVDSGTSTLLGTLNATPYQFTTTVPASATGSVSYFATAVDAYGNTGDSDYAVVTITD